MKIKPLSYAVSAIMLSYLSHTPMAQAAVSSKTVTDTQDQKQTPSQQASETDSTPDSASNPIAIFDTITVPPSSTHVPSSLAFDNAQKASDVVIDNEKLRHRSATLGNALADELGVHSNPFGGGSSAPVVRGQEGVRVKILQNGMDAIDMSTLSPDHVVGVDTLLADKVELIRGASTLLYSNASPAGVINVVDGRIPTEVPEGYTGEATLRFNENNDERVATAGITFGLTDNVALRVEGLTRKANEYEVPEINLGDKLNYLPDSQNKSNVGTIGLSYVGERGHIGVAYSEREDKYGLVGHNHKLDGCYGHVVYPQKNYKNKPYLAAYPHLMGDEDLAESFHFHCDSDHNEDEPHSHDNPYGHDHDHTQGGPWVDMNSKSYYLQGELLEPIPAIEKVRLNVAYHDYHHEEHDHGKTIPDPAKGERFVKAQPSYFDNQGYNAKLEAYHTPTEHLQGVWGIQSQSHKSSALIPSKEEHPQNRRPLVENKHRQFSVFGVEQYKLNDWLFEAGLRYEHSKIPVTYNLDEIEAQNKILGQLLKPEQPDLTPYQESAFSYALGAIWDMTPEYRLDMSYSHNERLPTPMELYYHGKNLATNSFLYGNKDLDKEESDNFELGIQFTGDKWRYKASAYSNHFDNYVHAENLHKDGNLYMRRMTQSKAKIQGLEAEVGYEYLPGHSATLFGDYVRGKLYGFAPVYGNEIKSQNEVIKYMPPEECGASPGDDVYEEWCGYPDYEVIGIDKVERPERNAPRMSPLRLGLRLNNEYNDNWSTSLDFTRVFAQNKTSTATVVNIPRDESRLKVTEVPEDSTSGYSLLNVGVDYKNTWDNAKHPVDYTLSLRANNLLDEYIYVHNSFLPYVPQMGRNFMLSLNVEF
ncbi:TonB-dependent receptor [Psychrobacter phenylpyruvicus]|uniref:Probable TonB-dependent receptor NMB0964 n=1 Tax=Psychrobacter phenylpyruvicus TaxID=29432 RepID=A0A379LJ25_9GAMM|nr:TonB-dependent receptor [Psychrobacter phenylpyruvicus]SUD90543.1 Probable TonB-dependent receptor NMB0964 precursor [Psychrobacter phenylpyruvicus]